MILRLKKENLFYDSRFDEKVTLYTYDNVSREELEREAKRLTFSSPCDCIHDCCGCFVRQYADVKSDNTIEVIECYNY